jgi:purine catabolism regulator
MATFVELRAAVARTGHPVGDPSTWSTAPLSWVRVLRARVPAFDALDAGDLAILPATALALIAPTTLEAESIAAAVLGAGAGGALLVEGETADETARLAEVEKVLARGHLPAMRLARTDVTALERSVVGFLVNERAELDRQASLLEARLERIALDGGGAAALVAEVAAFLGRPVALEGRRGQALAVHAPADAPASAGAAAAAAGARARRAALRVPLAASGASGGGAMGSIALLGAEAPGDLERIALGRAAGVIALELARDEAIGRAREGARRTEALPGGGPPWVMLVARQRGTEPEGADSGDRDDDEHGGRAARESIRRELRALAPARRLALRGDADSLEIRAVLAAPLAQDPEGLELSDRIARFLGRTVAVSRPFSNPADRPAAEAEARETLQAAERLSSPPPVARATRRPAYRLLGDLHNLPDGAAHARALLQPLLDSRPDVRREHLATLRALLDRGGVNEAAGALGVHRNTVAYRARRIEALTGWRLSDPELRLPLALAVRLVQDD